jgi:xyloglucan fucosyltransferase
MVVMNFDRGFKVSNMVKGRRSWRVLVVLVFLVVMVSFNFDQASRTWNDMLLNGYRSQDYILWKNGWRNRTMEGPQLAEKLLMKLRETIRLAAHSADEYNISAAESKAWHEKNPCDSRQELPAMYAARKRVEDIAPNPLWAQIFHEYSNLHRVCLKRVTDLTDTFYNKANVTIPGCKFAIADGQFGLGNKLLVTVSSLLYAILTQRVLLMHHYMTLKSVLCEPFVGSSWIIPDDNFPLPLEWDRKTWTDPHVFVQKVKDSLNENGHTASLSDEFVAESAEKKPPLLDSVIVTGIWSGMPWMPQKWFYCKTEQKYLSEIPWLYLSGCIYTIPELFDSPAFGTTLQSLFPDGVVATRLLRSALLPSTSVWGRFKHLNHLYFQNADRRVGIQLRLFDGTQDSVHQKINDRVMSCVLNNKILPDVNWTDNDFTSTRTGASAAVRTEASAPVTVVYIASLYTELKNHMSELYLKQPTVTGEAVSLVQITNRQWQASGEEEDRQALVEILLLSVSDMVLVTPVSTFGGMAHVYGGLVPWFIRSFDDDWAAPCEQGQTTDTCEQTGSLGYQCPNDPSIPLPSTGVLAKCLKIDLGKRIDSGFQILDNRAVQ